MPPSDGGERTEPATGRRREEARSEGNVARSPDLSSAVILLGGLLFFAVYGPKLTEDLSALTVFILRDLGSIRVSFETLSSQSVWLTLTLVRILMPFFIVVGILAYFSDLIQVGFLTKKFKIDLNKINPLTGMKRLFSQQKFVKLGFDLVRTVIVGKIVYDTIRGALPQLMALWDMNVAQILAFTSDTVLTLLLKVFFALFVIGLIDYGYQRWKYEQDLKMTKEEVKEEMKRQEGDPAVKVRIRTIQMQMARQRMFSKIKDADVVITNPVHLAVAVKYDPASMSAPKVVAKGARLIAERIKKIAAEHKVPIVENKPLARTLFKSVSVDKEIPARLYQAVAEVLAYVYQLNRHGARSPAS
jgi:flagellar biosynthetic protein FlhB